MKMDKYKLQVRQISGASMLAPGKWTYRILDEHGKVFWIAGFFQFTETKEAAERLVRAKYKQLTNANGTDWEDVELSEVH